jgi:hypothetical protein
VNDRVRDHVHVSGHENVHGCDDGVP